MVIVRNKKQGTEWEIKDPAMLKRMRADHDHYEVMDKPVGATVEVTGKDATTKQGKPPDKGIKLDSGGKGQG